MLNPAIRPAEHSRRTRSIFSCVLQWCVDRILGRLCPDLGCHNVDVFRYTSNTAGVIGGGGSPDDARFMLTRTDAELIEKMTSQRIQTQQEGMAVVHPQRRAQPLTDEALTELALILRLFHRSDAAGLLAVLSFLWRLMRGSPSKSLCLLQPSE